MHNTATLTVHADADLALRLIRLGRLPDKFEQEPQVAGQGKTYVATYNITALTPALSERVLAAVNGIKI